MAMDIDIKNENEILRIYENNLKNAKTDAEKAKWNDSIVKLQSEINKLEEEEKAMQIVRD